MKEVCTYLNSILKYLNITEMSIHHILYNIIMNAVNMTF